jgi:signal transduction histidine kinase
MARLRQVPLHSRLLVLVGVALLPVVALALAGLFVLGRQQHVLTQQALVEKARALASAIDLELTSSIEALEILALSENLSSRNLAAFFVQAQSAVKLRSDWDGVILIDPSGNRLLNTRVPYGLPLRGGPAVVESESFAAVLATQRPSIGNTTKGPGGQHRFPVRVPVIRDGELRFALTAFVKPEAMLAILERQKVPKESVSTIFDARMSIVARSRNHDQYVGFPVSETLRGLMGGTPEGWGITTTHEGQEVYTAFSHSPRSKWGIALGVPKGLVDAPIWRSYGISGAGILLSLALGGIAAVSLTRRIARPIAQLRLAAQAVGRREVPATAQANIPEIDEVAHALAAAATELRDSEERLRVLNATLEARVEERTNQLRTINAELEAANRELEAFSYSVSHDLRAPLRAIDGFSQIVVSEHATRLPQEGQRHLQLVRSNVQQMGHLIDALLAFARVGRQTLTRERFELRPIVEECLDKVRSEYVNRDVEVVVNELPPCGGDPILLRQALLNLIGNAFKYTGKTKSARVVIGCDRRDDEDVFHVRDNGVGFDMKYVHKLFGVFRRLHRREDFEGTGVGLAIVQRIVHRHGGRVWAEAEVGQGATFFFTLPRVAE